MPQQKQKTAREQQLFKARSSETDSSLLLRRNGDQPHHQHLSQQDCSPASVSTSLTETQKLLTQRDGPQSKSQSTSTQQQQVEPSTTSTTTHSSSGGVVPMDSTMVSSDRGDYTSLVKKKYFGGGGTTAVVHNNNGTTSVHPPLQPTYYSNGTSGGVRANSNTGASVNFVDERFNRQSSSSNFSLSEMFETTEDGTLSRTGSAVYASPATTIGGGSARLNTQWIHREEEEDDNEDGGYIWSEGGGGGGGDDSSDRYDDQRINQNRTRRGYASPPLTLYSTAATIKSTNDSDRPYATESAGVMSPLTTPGMDFSLLRNTPSSKATSFGDWSSPVPDPLLTSSATSSPASCVLLGSVNSSTASSLKQPILYSAIGSLECFNTNSLTTLNNRYMAPSKEFCRPGGGGGGTTVNQSLLIPPVQHGTRHQIRRSNPETLSNTQLDPPRQIQPYPDNYVENHSNHKAVQKEGGQDVESSMMPAHGQGPSSSRKTSSTATSTASRKLNGGQVFGVFKRNAASKQQQQQQHDDDENLTKEFKEGRDQENKQESNLHSAGTTTIMKGKKVDFNNKNNGSKASNGKSSTKKVTYGPGVVREAKSKKPIEMFRPSSDAYTPRIERKSIKYKAAEARTPVQHMASPMGTLQRPNFRDALRRVAMIIRQHVVKIEGRFEGQSDTKLANDDGLFKASMRDLFHEDTYRTPTYKCTMVRIPMARAGMVYGLRKIQVMYEIPSETEIYNFAHQLFKSVQLSSECSIVCLIYIERLMEVAKVPLLASTWRPIFLCGLLLASKVWQDLSSWNIEFTSVYPQFSLEAINRLELNFLRHIKWDLFISSSLYAKYYFALRALVEKVDFRQRYNRMVGGIDNVAQSEALKVQKNTQRVKEEALLQYSRSMPDTFSSGRATHHH